jgi:hypothetical protein
LFRKGTEDGVEGFCLVYTRRLTIYKLANIVIDCPELIQNARVAPDKVRLLQDAAIVAKREARAITDAVSRALMDPSAQSAERVAAARRAFYRPGSATARAVECIYNALELATPAAVTDPVAVSAPAALSSSRTSHHV